MNELFHILSRGVDKRRIFLNNKDYFRFIHNLFEFNDIEPPISNFNYFFNRNNKSMVIARPYIVESRKREKRKLLVDIHAFCLMPNHYHLLISPRIENGIPKFMKKLNMGYARYFNEKYKRKGTLFESRYKSISVKNEAHFIFLPYYIHLNPLDLVMPEWRTGDIKDYEKAIEFLDTYRWSSHLDYLGKKNFPSITQRGFLTAIFNEAGDYKNNIKEYIRNQDSIENNQDIVLQDIVLE